jgi:hypothetical protein
MGSIETIGIDPAAVSLAGIASAPASARHMPPTVRRARRGAASCGMPAKPTSRTMSDRPLPPFSIIRPQAGCPARGTARASQRYPAFSPRSPIRQRSAPCGRSAPNAISGNGAVSLPTTPSRRTAKKRPAVSATTRQTANVASARASPSSTPRKRGSDVRYKPAPVRTLYGNGSLDRRWVRKSWAVRRLMKIVHPRRRVMWTS